MDFLDINLPQEMDITNIYSNEEFEYEDDAFYNKLKRQVLQLMGEEEDGDQEFYENKNPNVVGPRKQGNTIGPYGVLKPKFYYNWPGNMDEYTAPAWILNLWRTGNGTGVFIPQVVQSRRRNRPRRNKSGGGRTYKQVEKMN